MRHLVCIALLLAGASGAPALLEQRSEPLAPAALASIRFVEGLEQPDGSFLAAVPTKADAKIAGGLRATSAALRAMKYFGARPRERPKTAKFVESCFDEKSGGFADVPGGKPDVFLTAVGLMAAAELKLPKEPYVVKGVKYLAENAKGFEDIRIAVAGMEAVNDFPPIVKKWHEEVLKRSNGDGTWGDADKARATGGAVALLLRSGGILDETQRKNALEAMRAGQHEGGGFGKESRSPSELESSYRIMRALHLLHEMPKRPEAVKDFIGKCRNSDGGYGAKPGERSTVGGTYYAAIMLHWLGE